MDENNAAETKPENQPPPMPQPVEGAPVQAGTPTPGLSQSPGLREVPNSKVPGLAGGGMISHVFGPGQAPVDPIAAGLDLGYNPLTRAENRVITQTGVLAAGPRPSTYAHIGGEPVQQAGPADHANVPAASDEDSVNRLSSAAPMAPKT